LLRPDLSGLAMTGISAFSSEKDCKKTGNMIITLYENGLISTEKSGIMDDTPPQAAGYRLLSWPSFRA